ncbi:MAG: Large extracellular alpha-helical protein [Chthonomonadaceae bacterium]|nr:Large extracellular alpha-helical protein [Chthonomonadaceae bacterium]
MRYSLLACAGIMLCVGLGTAPTLAQQRSGLSVLVAATGRHGKDPKKDPKSEFTISPLETRVLGQRNWLRGGPAGLRVIVLDHQTGKPVRAQVIANLERMENGKPVPVQTLYTGTTNGLGTLDASFNAPAMEPGAYQLHIDVKSALGNDTVQQLIQLTESVQVLLTSDKPLYQPGQTIHIRSLALDMATRKALGDQPVTFEVEDARGNKVFKKRDKLTAFGLASADFVLADEVNMGTFTLRAILPQGQTEKKITVQRYVLPKFKLAVTTDKPYYLPGEEVHGTVKANYFFGKPVADGKVTVTVNTLDIGVTKLTELNGTTSAIGAYTFRYTLPNSFVGQSFEQGKGVVEFAASLKDTADHKQESHLSVPVVKDPISLVVVSEHRGLVPNVANRIYIAAATPDGTPLKNAPIDVSMTSTGPPQPGAPANAVPGTKLMGSKALKTDDLGLAVYEFTPGNDPVVLNVTATDDKGRKATNVQALQFAAAQDGLILRTDKTLAKVGDRLNLEALCSMKGGTLYLDVIRNKQTILTRAETLTGNGSHFTLPLTHDMVGTLEIHAYNILHTEEIIRDTRTVLVSPADDLNISISADKQEYKPGGDATIKFSVLDQQHRPVQAALGLAMVDESVFALSELQPGLEKIYFLLEKELMEPRYEIHGLRPTGLLHLDPGPIPIRRDVERQRAAAMLLCAVPRKGDFEIKVDTYQERFQVMRVKVMQVMQQTHQKIWNALAKYQADTKTPLTADESLMKLVEKGYLQEADLLDPWGHFYKSDLNGQNIYTMYFVLNSAGPDGKWSTSDDIIGVSQYGWADNGIRRRGGMVFNRAMAAGAAGPQGGGFGGGGIGGGRAEDFALDAARPALAMRAVEKAALADSKDDRDKTKSEPGASGSGGSAPRVREYFPETMYWNPMLLTDDKGQAEIRVPMADSITTWRMSAMANSLNGQLGSATSGVKVFQDFFVDIDLPLSLTKDDHVEIPVAVYNYLPTAQTVSLKLETQPWFRLQGEATQSLKIESGQVKVIYYPITVNAIGNHALMVTAKGSKLSDAVRRQIEVTPNGKRVDVAINDRLEHKAEKTFTVPANAIQGASACYVKLYPGTFSQVVEGLDGILSMPGGCFEQTSSTTYPDLLVLDYLKTTKKINPELQMKAEQYINVGYQRLVTFECKNGGFSWFGNEPAHQILTAYGLLEFSDMAKVHDVDPAVITRTQNWLASRQKPDGTWEETGSGIAEGIINRQSGVLRSTAYVAWALAESGYNGPQVMKGVGYVKEHGAEAKDPYTLAVILNLLTKVEKEADTTAKFADALIAMAKTDDKAAWWQSDTQTFTGAKAEGADQETTGLAAYGLVKWGRNSGFTNKVLTYLIQGRNTYGTWSSTQGTVWSMKSLLYASRNGTGGSKGTVTILANGQKAGSFQLTADDNDVMRQVNLAEFLHDGQANNVTLSYDGEGSLLYQIAGRYYEPWADAAPPRAGFEPLALKVDYDKTTLAQDDTATVTVTIHNQTTSIAEMPLIDVGVPPGFTVNPEKLEDAVAKQTISKYTVAARQVILYMEKLGPGETVVLTYQIRAKYPIKARTPLSKVYPYYNPERVTVSAPQDIVVTK